MITWLLHSMLWIMTNYYHSFQLVWGGLAVGMPHLEGKDAHRPVVSYSLAGNRRYVKVCFRGGYSLHIYLATACSCMQVMVHLE